MADSIDSVADKPICPGCKEPYSDEEMQPYLEACFGDNGEMPFDGNGDLVFAEVAFVPGERHCYKCRKTFPPSEWRGHLADFFVAVESEDNPRRLPAAMVILELLAKLYCAGNPYVAEFRQNIKLARHLEGLLEADLGKDRAARMRLKLPEVVEFLRGKVAERERAIEGPHGNCSWRKPDGTVIDDSMQPLPWRLVDYLWNHPKRSASFDELGKPIYDDAEHPADETTYGSLRKKANGFFVKHEIPYRLSAVNRIVALQPIQENSAPPGKARQ